MRIDEDGTYCCLDGGVLRDALKNEKVLDALLDVLQVPGKPATLRPLSAKHNLRAIEDQAEHYRRTKTSVRYEVEPAEVVAASIWRSRLGDRFVMELFCEVSKEAASSNQSRHGWSMPDSRLMPKCRCVGAVRTSLATGKRPCSACALPASRRLGRVEERPPAAEARVGPDGYIRRA